MKKSPLLFTIVLLAIQVSAQRQQFIDSLKQDLTAVTDDSLRFRVLDELAWTYRRIHADSALAFGNESLVLAEKLDERLVSISYSTLGVIKKENGIGDFGVSDLEKSLEINTKNGNMRGIASNLTNLGGAFEYQGRFDKSVEATTRAIEIKLELGNEQSAASTMSNLGLTYQMMGNTDKAIDYFEQALEIVGLESRRSKGILHNLGVSYMSKGDYPKARSYYLQSIKGRKEEENESTFSSVFGNLGLTFFNEKQYDSALFYTLKSFRLKEQMGQRAQLVHPAVTLAKIYLELDNLTEARKYAKLGLDVTTENPALDQQTEALYMLARIENRAENFEGSVKYYQQYDVLKDSILSTSILKAAEEAEAKFQNQLKNNENELLKIEAQSQQQVIQNQNLIIVSVAIVSILLLAIAFLLRKQLKERKVLMNHIKAQSEKLKELDKAKTRFFANISHDLRSPLTLILGALDKITERDSEVLDGESKELLDVGYKNGKRLLYLADEIMDLTRLEEGKVALDLQHVKIVPYLRLLTKMFSSAADIKRIELKFATDADEETILKLDPHQFEKIVYNLLSNAIKFTPEGGEVVVDLKGSKNQLEMIVSDSGPGIPQESIDYIFDRYYQSASNGFNAQAGVGIGLALVKELVELHDGTITVESSLTGTTFHISIPFKESDWVSKAIIPERSLDVVTRNSLWVDLQEEREKLQVSSLTNLDENAKAILIVEDHKELRSYLKSILATDYRVYLAANGASALDLLQSEKIDLIITDLMMPYMDGFELIDHLKKDKELKKLPVVVVSARTDQAEKLDLLAKGADEIISKPFDKEELFLRIKNALSKEWDSGQKLGKLYGETAQEFEKNIMARLERLIIKRIDDPHLSVLDLADEMAASERKVYRMVKKISGLTPYELIKEIRWQYLEKHLKNNRVRTASEAAQLIGMSNPSFFAEQYTKRFGHPLAKALDS